MGIEHSNNIEISSLSRTNPASSSPFTEGKGVDIPSAACCWRPWGYQQIASKTERSLLLKMSPMIDEKWCYV